MTWKRTLISPSQTLLHSCDLVTRNITAVGNWEHQDFEDENVFETNFGELYMPTAILSLPRASLLLAFH